MAIPEEMIRQFRASIENEFKGEQLVIPEADKESFWNWFQNNALAMGTVPLDSLEETQFRGICFDIGQKIQKSKSIDYCEGFLLLGDEPVYHGYNLKDNKVLDYTAKKHLMDYKKMNLNKLPSEYYGVIIPKDFIEAENSEFLEGDQINLPPLLYKFFKSMK